VSGMGEAELRAAIRRWRKRQVTGMGVEGFNDAPACVFGMMTRELLDSLSGDMDDIKSEIRWIRRVIVTAVVGAAVATLLRMLGWVA